MITNRIRLKADVGSIKKGRVVDVFEGDGYWYIKDGKQNRTVIPTAHEALLPKYVVKERSGTYALRKDYMVEGERFSVFIGGLEAPQEAFEYSDIMKKYDVIIQKLMKRVKSSAEVVTVIQPGDLELDELKKENEDLQVSYEKAIELLDSERSKNVKLSEELKNLSEDKKVLAIHKNDLERINQERAEKEKEMKQIIDKLEKEKEELKEQMTKTKLESEFFRRVTEGQYYKDIGSKLDEILKVTHENSKGGIWSRLLGGK